MQFVISVKILEFNLFLVPLKMGCVGDFFYTLLGYEAWLFHLIMIYIDIGLIIFDWNNILSDGRKH